LEKFQMKKTLVAIAALASVSAFAQTSVVLDGFIDRGYVTTNNTNDASDTKLIGSNSGTTTVGIKVREDLGGGLSAGLSISNDWSELGGNTATNSVANAQATGFANGQSFLDITSASFGTIRLGAPNNFTLTNATAISTPAFSTGVGSQYSSAYSFAAGAGTGTSGRGGTVDFTGANTATASNSAARAIRIANTIQYSSPSFNGASVHVGYTQANNNVTTISGAGNTPGVSETALRYTNGPVDAMYSTIKYTVGSNGISQTVCVMTSGVCVLTADTNAAQTSTQNLLGVQYQALPGLKLNFGSGSYSSSTGTYQGTSKNYGGTYTMGNWDIMLLTSATDDKSTTNFDKKMTGYGLNYNLSKQTRAYVRMDNLNYGSNVAATAGSAVKRTAFGVSKSF
jgi:predicted porin